MGAKNRRISVDLPPELVDLVDARAREAGQSRNTFIVRCLKTGVYPDLVLDADGVLRRVTEVPAALPGNRSVAPKETEMPQASVVPDGETQSFELAADREKRNCPRCHKPRVSRGGIWVCPEHGDDLL